jgi:SAM-dependent methyltransferase
MLNEWDAVWDLHEDQCPCDVHFVAFLEAQEIANASIFHFGTGAHHHVGIRTAQNGDGNAVLGITASRGEFDAYVKLALERPEISRSYKVLFGDIYILEERLLPEFDVATLFHLCEFRSEKNDAYDALTDLDLARMMIRKLRPGGWLLFYTGSMAFDATRAVIAELEARRLMEPAGAYKTLLLYRKPDIAKVAPSL